MPGTGTGISVLQVACQVLSHHFFLLTLSYVWNGGLYLKLKQFCTANLMVEGSNDVCKSDWWRQCLPSHQPHCIYTIFNGSQHTDQITRSVIQSFQTNHKFHPPFNRLTVEYGLICAQLATLGGRQNKSSDHRLADVHAGLTDFQHT